MSCAGGRRLPAWHPRGETLGSYFYRLLLLRAPPSPVLGPRLELCPSAQRGRGVSCSAPTDAWHRWYRWYCRYDAMMDEYLEDSYQAWKQRQRIKGDIVKKRRRRIGDAGELRRADVQRY